MRTIISLILLFSLSQSAEVVKLSKQYQSANNCKVCHRQIVEDWENSWHKKSHYGNDEYLKKSIDFVAKKTRVGVDIVKVECAKCHNPRITKTTISDTDKITESLGLNADLQKAVNDKTIAEGINCLVCHNVEAIHQNAPQNVRGIDRLQWTKNGLMSGPFSDANSPYHKTQQRDFFTNNPNKLCFVCHANDHSQTNAKLVFTNMEKEYKGNQKCVECHMGPKTKGVAATYRMNNLPPKKRMVRHHKFIGAHTETFWRDALGLSLKKSGESILITLTNPQPHNLPTGFGGREILIEVKYFKGTKKIAQKLLSLTTHYKRKRGKASIPHTALKASKNISIPAKGSKTIKVQNNEEATMVEVNVYYRLVNDELRRLLNLQEPIWEKKFFITSATLK